MEINSSARKPSRQRVTSALKLDESTPTENLDTTRRDLQALRKPPGPVDGLLPHLAQLHAGEAPPPP
jgi:hypothetical protein